jgi:hypothetical protein
MESSGMYGGPGGRVVAVVLVEKMALMRKMMHRDTSAMNHDDSI